MLYSLYKTNFLYLLRKTRVAEKRTKESLRKEESLRRRQK
jgi:hypothetical protein